MNPSTFPMAMSKGGSKKKDPVVWNLCCHSFGHAPIMWAGTKFHPNRQKLNRNKRWPTINCQLLEFLGLLRPHFQRAVRMNFNVGQNFKTKRWNWYLGWSALIISASGRTVSTLGLGPQGESPPSTGLTRLHARSDKFHTIYPEFNLNVGIVKINFKFLSLVW